MPKKSLTISPEFGEKLKEFRLSKRATQQEIAALLGLESVKQVQRYEKGMIPDMDKLLRLGKFFKYDFIGLLKSGHQESSVSENKPHYAPQNLDSVLPVGPVKTTLADYIALQEKHIKFLESGFNLGKILSNQSDGLDALTRIEQTLAGKAGAPSQDSWDRFQDGMNRLILTLADQQKGKSAVGSLNRKK